MKVGEIYGKNRNKKLLVMYIDFFLMTLFGGIYNIYTSKNYYICTTKVAIIGEIWKSRAKLLRNRLFENIASVTG